MDGTVGTERSESLVTGYTGRVLIVISIGWGFIQTGRLVVSPLLPQISANLGLSSTRAGFAITVLWGLYALLQYPSGRLSDKLSRKTLLIGGLGLVSLGFVVLSVTPTYGVLLGGAAIVGVGAGLYPTPARALLSDLFVARRGQAFGLHTASGDVGGIIAAGLATVVLAVATWRAAFVPVALVLFVVALALHHWSREDYVFASVDLAIGDTGQRIFKESRFRWLLLAYALYAFSWQATAGFLPTFLQVSKDFSPTVANASFGALFIIGAVVKPIAGGLGDRISRVVLAPAALALAAAMLLGVILASDSLMVMVAVACFAAGLMAFPPVMQAYLMDAFPSDSMAGDLGAMRTIYIGIGSLGPTYVGVVADARGFTTAFTGLLGCLVMSSLLIILLGRE